jgi:hypothetical protein
MFNPQLDVVPKNVRQPLRLPKNNSAGDALALQVITFV